MWQGSKHYKSLPIAQRQRGGGYSNPLFPKLLKNGAFSLTTHLTWASEGVSEHLVWTSFCRNKEEALLSVDSTSTKTSGDYKMEGSEKPNPWRLCTVTRMEELKMMVRILPIWATTIFYCPVHAQMVTSSMQQVATLDRSIRKFKYLQLHSLSSSLGSPLGQQWSLSPFMTIWLCLFCFTLFPLFMIN